MAREKSLPLLEEPPEKAAPPRGVISTSRSRVTGVTHTRYEVAAPLDRSIEHWWTVAWNLSPGTEHVGATLPHPSVHVIWERGKVEVAGVPKGRFVRVLRGEGRVFAAKFRPGGFRALHGRAVSELSGKVVPLARIVGAMAARAYGRALDAAEGDAERVAIATRFFAPLVPPPSPEVEAIGALVALAASDRSITTAEALRARSGLHLRELQRRFRDVVGVSPKWVVQRYRLHEALGRLERRDVTLAALAAELGYADQAHFARDFKALVGVPPSVYASGRAP